MESLWNLEINITLFFQSLGDWLTTPFQAISFLATEIFFIVIIPLIYWSVNSVMGIRMAMMLVINGGFNACFKMLFHSPRPFWFDQRVKSLSMETSFGLPSGHSQNAASLWGMAAATAKKKWLTIIVIFIVFLIGISRIFLGMHFTRDVLTGWLLGGFFIWIYLILEKPVVKWMAPKKLPLQILYSLLFSVILILLGLGSSLISTTWQMPAAWVENATMTGGTIPDPFNLEGIFTIAGVAFGFLAGYSWWVKKYGQPKVEGSFAKRFLRYLVGIIGLVVIYLGLKMILPEEPQILGFTLRFVRYSLVGLWVSALAPALFIKMKLNR